MRPGETLSLTVTLPNEQRIEIPEAEVRWLRGQGFAVENISEIYRTMRATHPLALLLIRESQWDFGWILKICPPALLRFSQSFRI